jgi:hypothetical protein
MTQGYADFPVPASTQSLPSCNGNLVNALVTGQPLLLIDRDACQPGWRCVSVHNLHPDLIAYLRGCSQSHLVLQSVLRVRVVGAGARGGEDLPDILGRYQILEAGVRFVPHFPFETGVRFRALFDLRPLGRPELSQVLTLEFSLPRQMSSVPARVKRIFPSGDSLPENLLRFYVGFSSPMQRGHADKHVALLGPDGRPAADVLYRPPIELWDRSMMYLTILLDPGRIKRGVGPNRALGPPLKAGQAYTLAIGYGMVDASGRPLLKSFYKSFRVTEAVRERIAVEKWKILPPATNSHQSLELIFPQRLDWALLRHSITIASDAGQPLDGHVSTDQEERRWSFTPKSRWAAGAYSIHVAPSLEDVCGNRLSEAFDRPLRSGGDFAHGTGERLNALSFVTVAADAPGPRAEFRSAQRAWCPPSRSAAAAHRKASKALASASGCSSGTKCPESGITIDLTSLK